MKETNSVPDEKEGVTRFSKIFPEEDKRILENSLFLKVLGEKRLLSTELASVTVSVTDKLVSMGFFTRVTDASGSNHLP